MAMYASLGEGMDQFDEEQEGEDIFGPPETKKRQLKSGKQQYLGHRRLDTKLILIEDARGSGLYICLKKEDQLLERMPWPSSQYFFDEEDVGCKYTPKQGGKNYNSCKTALDAKDEHTDMFSIEFYHVFIKEPSV